MTKDPPESRVRVPIRAIQSMVALDTRISIAKMISGSTDQPVVAARHAAMWLARQVDYTPSEIGRAFGDRDDTAVKNAVDLIERAIETDPALVAFLHTYDLVLTEPAPR